MLGKGAKVLCSFQMTFVKNKVDIKKSKITCNKYKKPKKNMTVKKRKITSSSGNIFTITMIVKKKGGKATLKQATVLIAPAIGIIKVDCLNVTTKLVFTA